MKSLANMECISHGSPQWKKQALEELPQIFSNRRENAEQAEEELKAALYQQIGQLKVELDWLKKKLSEAVEMKRVVHYPLTFTYLLQKRILNQLTESVSLSF